MTTLNEYINKKYKGASNWFVEEVANVRHMERTQAIEDVQDYLEGHHAILNSPSYEWNGKMIVPRKIVLNQAHGIVNFQTSFLLGNKVTITGNESLINPLNEVYRKGKYNRLDFKILESTLKYGECYEYVYMKENGGIQSKLIQGDHSYPVWNENKEMVGFIEHQVFDAISYYTVYDEDFVTRFDNEGGEIRMTERFINLSGLPIYYINPSSDDMTKGVSELKRWSNILDHQEDLISKAVDGYYKYINGIPVMIGQQLVGEGLPTNVIGGGISLDDGSDFKFVSNTFDSVAFDTLYNQLERVLYNVAQIPSVANGNSTIANVSTESIKILFNDAIMKAQYNEMFMSEGIEKRLRVITDMLQLYKGVSINDDDRNTMEIKFNYNIPSSDTELVENLKTLRESGAMSVMSMIERNPYVTDKKGEYERLMNEDVVEDRVSSVDVSSESVNDDDKKLVEQSTTDK